MRLTISVAQMAVKQSDPEANLAKGEKMIMEAVRRKSDMICFPEMWTTGFDWEYLKRSLRDHEKVIDRIAGMAKKHRIWINGSTIAMNKDGSASNTSILFDSGGTVAGRYRKAHLFSAISEEKHLKPGDSLCVADTPWGRIALAVCYDIRFPELFRAYAMKGAEIVLSPSAFPYPKLHHWKALTRARAIENQLFFVGVNQAGSEDLGPDGKKEYLGDSVIIDPWGDVLAEAREAREELITAEIDMAKVAEVRSKMAVLKDRRPELYG